MANGGIETGFVPGAENTRAFRDALGRFATGVAVITCTGPEGPTGFTANSFAALSLDPPLVLWSPAKSSSRHDLLTSATSFAIHILRADHGALAGRFVRGGQGFDGLPMVLSPLGTPALPDPLARFDCTRHAVFDGGDHSIVVGRVLHATLSTGAPLVFSAGRYGTFAAADV